MPDSLYKFISIVCIKQSNNYADIYETTCSSDSETPNPEHVKLLNIAQDIIYLLSKGHRQTPKHIGLSVTVHQNTRSTEHVELLSHAGHGASVPTIQRLDTGVAEGLDGRGAFNASTPGRGHK